MHKVKVRRVVLPMLRTEGEAPRMFEIINLRGQDLSSLDIFKAHLLHKIGEDENERKVFTNFWLDLENAINNKRPCSEIKDINKNDKSENLSIYPSKFTDILKTTIIDNKSEWNNKNPVLEEPKFTVPINLTNLLIMSAVLMKHWPYANQANSQENQIEDGADALGVGSIDGIFKGISKGITKSAHVWQLLGAASIVLMTTVVWGLYRTLDKDLRPIDTADAFNQLTLSFFAHNNYRYSGQYWHLLLSAYAGLKVIGPIFEKQYQTKTLPENCERFCSFVNVVRDRKRFLDHKKEAFALLCQWACCYAINRDEMDENNYQFLQQTNRVTKFEDQLWYAAAWKNATTFSSLTDSVFYLVQRFVDGNCQQLPKFNPNAARWHNDAYNKRWRLYLTDYLMWADCSFSKFAQMKKAFENFSQKTGDQPTEDLKKALNFDNDIWQKFIDRVTKTKIVSKGSVEHWVPQTQHYEDQLTWHKVNQFGNLALIDRSSNSSLSNKNPSEKSKIVLDNDSNHSIKLYWLAVLSQQVSLERIHLEAITDFWFDYLGHYNFNDIRLD